jgi:hypothetical protein
MIAGHKKPINNQKVEKIVNHLDTTSQSRRSHIDTQTSNNNNKK